MQVVLLVATPNGNEKVSSQYMNEEQAGAALEEVNQAMQVTGNVTLVTEWGVFKQSTVLGAYLQGD
jgi:hypothetical protein